MSATVRVEEEDLGFLSAGVWRNSKLTVGRETMDRIIVVEDFVNRVASGTSFADGRMVVTFNGGNGTIATSDAKGGVLVVTPDSDDNDSCELQGNEIFLPAATKDVWFETRVKLADATQSELIAGLSITDTDIIGSLPNGCILFTKSDGDAEFSVVTKTAAGSTTTATGVDMVAATFVNLGFHIVSNTKVEFYIDGALVATHTTYIPAEELALSLGVKNGEGAAKVMSIDWIAAAQIR